MIRSNFHTHTSYCDGNHSPVEMVQQALALGLSRLGFSGHAHSTVEPYSMTAEGQRAYRNDILALREQYANRLEILCGLERDVYSDRPADRFDYIIGSVHYVEKDGVFLPVDESAALQAQAITAHFGGDFDAYAETYFAQVASLVPTVTPSVIGHLDLLMKFCETERLPESKRYLQAAEGCIASLTALSIPFEINTGGMARGYRSEPYPSRALLQRIHHHGGTILFSSDCHDKTALTYGFDAAVSLAKQCGFTRHTLLTRDGYATASL